MNFTSFVFLEWFLPIFLAAYYLMPARGKNILLTLASYVFYGWWRPDYIILMLVSTLVDFVCARAMGPVGDGRPRRRWLVLSLVTNLGLLAYFKYANLLVDSVSQVMVAGGGEPIPWETVILPIGISFFTFQSMSYTIDVYRGVVRPVRSFMDLACYVSMFPQLVAGPIVRYREVIAPGAGRRASRTTVSLCRIIPETQAAPSTTTSIRSISPTRPNSSTRR